MRSAYELLADEADAVTSAPSTSYDELAREADALVDTQPSDSNKLVLQPLDLNESPAMVTPKELPNREGLIAKASELKSRLGMQFWNKLIAEPAQSVSSPQEDDLNIAIGEALDSRISRYKKEIPPPSLTEPLKRTAYTRTLEKYVNESRLDIRRQLVELAPEARDDDNLKKYPQFAPKKPAMAVEVKPAETTGEKAVDVTTGLGAFVAHVVLLKKAMPGINEGLAWEITNL
ncbi:MAG: hypothetical protein MUO27_08265, partial [Sedimentisphaerales bacterium]|nr:hypothetical protein [Sedimentisphaerales bacterium]